MNYDLLRIISAIAVVMIHVCSPYKAAYIDEFDPYRLHIAATMTYQTLARFAVPCFFMLSGALLLSSAKNRDYHYFYRKSFISIGVPTIVFSVLYFLYSTAMHTAKIALNRESGIALLEAFKDVITGAPFYHMWYLYTLIWVYLAVPVLVRLKEDIGEHCFAVFSYIYFVVGIISGFDTYLAFTIHWSVAKSACFIGYLLIGYQIKRMTEKKNNFKAAGCIIIAIVLLLIMSYVKYEFIVRFIDEKHTIAGSLNPVIAAASVLIFAGFSLLDIRSQSKFITNLSNDTFLIYLIHAGVWSAGHVLLFAIAGGKTDPIYTIPLSVITVFLISWVLAGIYKLIWSFLDKDKRITNRLCDALHL